MRGCVILTLTNVFTLPPGSPKVPSGWPFVGGFHVMFGVWSDLLGPLRPFRAKHFDDYCHQAQVVGIEPTSTGLEAVVLPLHQTCMYSVVLKEFEGGFRAQHPLP